MKLLIILTFCLVSAKAFSQLGWDLYKLDKFEDVIKKHKKDDLVSDGFTLFGQPFKYAFNLKYDDSIRVTPSERLSLIEYWHKSFQGDTASSVYIYKNEIRMCSDTVCYWMTFQQNLFNAYLEISKEKKEITVYAILIGGINIDNNIDLVFLISRFDE